MNKNIYKTLLQLPLRCMWAVGLLTAALSVTSSAQTWTAVKKAFPGAAGYGQATTGGRGGTIYYVTSLADTNTPGTLRYAVNQTGARVIVFAVGGYIDLTSRLDITVGNITILGQTAPGDGITLRGNGLKIKEGVSNVVIRFLRVRPGVIQDEADAIDGRYLKNIIIDHSSFSWAIDETASIYASNNISFQWNLVAESLNNAGHAKGAHGYGGNWGGVNTSFHHNLLAHHKSRSPRLDGILDKWVDNKAIPSLDGVADIRNNVIYNNMTAPPYGGEGRDFQFINNYYKAGPATTDTNVKNFFVIASGRRLLYAEDRQYVLADYQAMLDAGTLNAKFIVNGAVAKPVGRLYIGGNYLAGNATVTANNQQGVRFDDANLAGNILQSTAFATTGNDVETFTPDVAYDLVLNSAGASLKRDAVDQRVINDVKNGTGAFGANGIIDTPNQVGGYPTLAGGTAPVDSDKDGMPDTWETANGLNPNSASDNWLMFQDLRGNYPEVYNLYTNAEVYWYSLVKHIPGANRGSAVAALGYDLTGRTIPAAADTAAYVDGELTLSFDAVPTLTGTGSVKIYRASDDALIDTVNAGSEQLVLGSNSSRLRTLKTELIRVADKKLIIRPHIALVYNTSYYVVISSDLVSGANLSGKAFTGLNKTHNWSFKTKVTAPSSTTITVDDDGAADFRSVQGAINHVTQNLGKDVAATIAIKNGIYEEPLLLRDKNNLTLSGESQAGVIIQYTNNNVINPGIGGTGTAGTVAGGRSVWLIEGVDNLLLEKLTIKNTTLIGVGGQAEAIYFNSDQGRLMGKSISLISEQDTMSLKGYSWFYKSLIAGNVDFIWGGNRVSLFEESEIRSLGDSRGNGSGGYVLQARTVTAADKGYVFLNSSFTRGAGPLGHTIADGKTLLGRTGGTTSFDSIALINCKVDVHISSNAFTDTPSIKGSANSGLRQYNTKNLSGAVLNLSGWSNFYTLTNSDVQANYTTRAQIFSAYGSGAGWNPQP